MTLGIKTLRLRRRGFAAIGSLPLTRKQLTLLSSILIFLVIAAICSMVLVRMTAEAAKEEEVKAQAAINSLRHLEEAVSAAELAIVNIYLASSSAEVKENSESIVEAKKYLLATLARADKQLLDYADYTNYRKELVSLAVFLEELNSRQQGEGNDAFIQVLSREIPQLRLRLRSSLSLLKVSMMNESDLALLALEGKINLARTLIVVLLVFTLTTSVTLAIAFFRKGMVAGVQSAAAGRSCISADSECHKVTDFSRGFGDSTGGKGAETAISVIPGIGSASTSNGTTVSFTASDFSTLSPGAQAQVRNIAFERLAKSMNELLALTAAEEVETARERSDLANSLDGVAKELEKVAGQIDNATLATDGNSYRAKFIKLFDEVACETRIICATADLEAKRTQKEELISIAAEVKTLADFSFNAAKEVRVIFEAGPSNQESVTRLKSAISRLLNELQRVSDFVCEVGESVRRRK